MSRTALAATGLLLTAVGFGLGHYVASPLDSGTASRGPADATPLRPGEARDALLDALRDPDAFARAARLATLLPTLGPEAVPEVRPTLENRAFSLEAAEIALLVRFWATHDPEAASEWALRRSPISYRGAAVVPAIELWATVDPEAALQKIGSLGKGGQNEAAEVALVRGWLASGLPGLEDHIRDLGWGFERQRALGQFARATIRRDGPEAIMRWAESLPDEDQRFKLSAFRQVASELAKADPAVAVAWCDAHCEGPFGSNVRGMIALRWAARDGPAAMQWLSTAPAGKDRDTAVLDAFRRWLNADRESASSWLSAKGLEGVEPWLGPAVGMYAMAISVDDPLEAMKWAALMEEEERREQVFIAIVRRWRGEDAQAAEAWLEQSHLSQEARARALADAPARAGLRRRVSASDAE